jgi:hypothetical protein
MSTIWGASVPKSEASGVTGETLERKPWNWGRTEQSKLGKTNLGGTNWGDDGGTTDRAQTAAADNARGPIIAKTGDGTLTGKKQEDKRLGQDPRGELGEQGVAKQQEHQQHWEEYQKEESHVQVTEIG